MKRLICLVLVIACLLPALGSDIGNSSSYYKLAIKWLADAEYGYKDVNNLAYARDALEMVPTASFYFQLKTYLGALQHVHSAGYQTDRAVDVADLDLSELILAITDFEKIENDTEFARELEENSLPLAEDFEKYIKALFYELSGESEMAVELYSDVPQLFDAAERIDSLDKGRKDDVYSQALSDYSRGRYYEAYLKFKSLGNGYRSADGTFAFMMADSALKKHRESHNFSAPTCDKPATCPVCGETNGSALGHTWIDATCTNPATCSRCGITTGNALGHNWMAATYDRPETCARCGMTRGSKLIPTPTPTPSVTPTPVFQPGQRYPLNYTPQSGRACNNGSIYIERTYESTHLSNQWGNYRCDNAFDNDSSTDWVEGSKGTQLGDYVGCIWRTGNSKIAAYGLMIKGGMQYKGYTSWERNQRPRNITVTVNGYTYYYQLQDTMNEQNIYFDGAIIMPDYNGRIDICVKVTSVYRLSESEYDIAINDIDLIYANLK